MDLVSLHYVELSVYRCNIVTSEGKYFHNRFVDFGLEKNL